MGLSTIALLTLAVLSCVNAFNTLIPQDKELVYHYHGLVKAGTHLPTSFASGFVLDGKLHMQTDLNSTFLKFSDLKYKMYNGDYDEWHEFETKEIGLPKELEDLEKTFRVVYDMDGEAMGITTGDNEEHFILNIKKAIASIMQLDMKKVDCKLTKPHAFHTEEHTVYGKGKTYYNVMPHGDWMTIEKMHEPHSSQHMYTHLTTNTQQTLCNAQYTEPLSQESQKVYKILKKDDLYYLDHIEATGGVYYHPMEGKSIAFHVYMNQTFDFIEMKSAEKKFEVASEKLHHGFTYRIADYADVTSILPDVTNGRRHWDVKKMVPKVEQWIHETVKYIEENHLDTKAPDAKQGQLINKMKEYMLYFDQATLQEIYETLKSGGDSYHALQIYYHMLPLLGTHASFKQIKMLVLEKKVKDHVAIEMLQNMPFYVQVPNVLLIDNMSEMMTWEDKVSHNVYKAAVLSFGTLIHKALDSYNRFHHKTTWTGFEHDHDSIEHIDEEEKYFKNAKYYEKYVVDMLTKLKSAKDLDTKTLWMQAMYNTKMMSVVYHLMPALKGEWWDDDYLTMVAAISMSPMVLQNEDTAFEVYWPMMTNTKLPTAHRIIAYYILMSAQPSIQRLINIYWEMQETDNLALYQFHYKYMKALSETTDPCREMFRVHLKQILRYTMMPECYGMTGYYVMDYTDTYDFGQLISWMLIHTEHETEKWFKFTLSHHFEHMEFVPYSVIMRIDGIDNSFFDIKLDLESSDKMFYMEKLLKLYTKVMHNENIAINIFLFHEKQSVMVYNFDKDNIMDLKEMFATEGNSYVKKFFHVYYSVANTLVVPTEIGFPVTYQHYIPTVSYFDWNLSWETVNKIVTIHVDTDYRSWTHGRVGLSFYNTIADVWQGVNKLYTYDRVLPILFDLSLNPEQHSMKLSWQKHDDHQKDIEGIKSHVTTVVFVADQLKWDVLKQSCPECDYVQTVSHGNEFRHEKTSLDKHDSNTGYYFQLMSFDSERHSINGTMDKLSRIFRTDSDQHYKTKFGMVLLSYMNMMLYKFKQPIPATNGFLFRYEPSSVYPVTNIDLNIRFSPEYEQKDMFLLPAVKYNIRATYSIKNKEKPLKTWDANLLLDYNLGHTSNTLKMYITRIIPGQKDFKMCCDGWMKWNFEKMNSQLNIAMTNSAEGKCTADDQFLEINLLGEKTDEQLDGKHTYGICNEYVWSDLHEQRPLGCYAAYNSLRKYTYDIKTTHMPTEYKKNIVYWFDWIKNIYMPYYSYADEPGMKVEENHMKIVMKYPMLGNVVDAKIYTPEHEYIFNGIPTEKWAHSAFLHPYNTQYSPMFQFMHHMGLTKTCFIEENLVWNIRDTEVKLNLPKEWTMYIGDTESDSKHGVWVKKIEGTDKIAMKIVHNTHTFEIIPTADKYEFIIDGKTLTDYHHSEDWFHYDWIKEHDVVSIKTHHLGSHMLYDGHHLQIEFPLTNLKYYGHCFDGVH